MLLMPAPAEINVMEEKRTNDSTTRAGRPCGPPRPAPTLRRQNPPEPASTGKRRMSERLDAITAARAMLMQPVLRAVSRHMHPAGMLALRAELAAMRDEHTEIGTTDALAMAEACEMALADLMIDGAMGITTGSPSGQPH
jgi:hypothetical protein